MAGSYNHVVDRQTGKLLDGKGINAMLECLSGDVVECVEEMFGMIWFLAKGDPALVEEARRHYAIGLQMSPGIGARLPDPED